MSEQQEITVQEIVIPVRPMGGAIGKSPDGETVLVVTQVVKLQFEIFMDEDMRRQVQKGLSSGIEVASAGDVQKVIEGTAVVMP